MKQFLILVLMLAFVFPAHLFAQETPTVVDLEKGEEAPYSGVLLNPTAAAQMLANKKFLGAECKLKIDFELGKLKARHDLMMRSLEITMAASEQKYTSIVGIKDKEIERLIIIAQERPNDYSHWWAAGGFIMGALVSVGIFYAAAQAAK